jgi:hypothetical protein
MRGEGGSERVGPLGGYRAENVGGPTRTSPPGDGAPFAYPAMLAPTRSQRVTKTAVWATMDGSTMRGGRFEIVA